jgi:hypothetical protein
VLAIALLMHMVALTTYSYAVTAFQICLAIVVARSRNSNRLLWSSASRATSLDPISTQLNNSEGIGTVAEWISTPIPYPSCSGSAMNSRVRACGLSRRQNTGTSPV